MKKLMLLVALIAVVGVANAAVNVPAGNITTSQTWTKANSPYNLQGQVFVTGGATLTMEAGTIVASTANVGGSLAICRDGMIKVMGTCDDPVIMTSSNDNFTTWREACNEWGNLTVMGSAHISDSLEAQNGDCPGNNWTVMEGLTGSSSTDPRILYGGTNDDDDSGEIHYLSLRYGGKVIGLGNELNGLSLGGIGRETEIDHVEIMNNVDDGIEIWGGTVELKYVNIWNIGDDSFDIDQGWRGSAQYGLIVQGYSIDASQGSGVGDNAIETDGAEDSDAHPRTTALISNFTVIGQPADGDGLTAWRDNARVQYNECIFMDCGEKVIRFDDIDGDGSHGYGYNGTMSWANHWTTSYDAWKSSYPCGDPTAIYDAYIRQDTSLPLCNISNSVFFGNIKSDAYTESDALGVTTSTNPWGNVVEPATLPIQSYARGSAVTKGGKIMVPVTSINPLPAAGVTAGGFRNHNWLAGWTATEAFGFTTGSVYPVGDVNQDCKVDLGDVSAVSENWLEGV